MAFITNNTSVWINTDTLNSDPKSKGFKEVPELSGFPSFGHSTETLAIETYDSEYIEKVAGNSTYGDVTITVNWVPSKHKFLDDIVKSRQLVQMKVEIPDEGQNDLTVNYALYNGYLASVSTSGDYDSVTSRSYVFTPNEQLSAGILDSTIVPLNRGDWGVGANGIEFPSYQGRDGNAFIKIPGAGSPTGTDVLGINNLDSNFGTQLVISKTGTPIINVRNYGASMGAWYKVYTSADKPSLAELGAASSASLADYVPITRTINSKPLTGNITLLASDIADVYSKTYIDQNVVPKVFQLNGHALSGTALNLVAADILDVYSQTQVDTSFVKKTTTVNGLSLSQNITLTAAQLPDMASIVFTNNTYVPKTYLINNKPLTGTNIQLVAADIPDVYSRTQSNDLFALRITTINGYALNSNIVLNFDDVGTYSKKQIDDKDKVLKEEIDTKVTIVEDILKLNTLVNNSLEIDLSDSKTTFTVTLSQPTSNFSVLNASGNDKKSQTFQVLIKQGTGANKISWPTNILWSYGRVPVLTFTKDSTDVFQFVTVDGGSTWYGSLLMADMK